jgi:hypothetical protein
MGATAIQRVHPVRAQSPIGDRLDAASRAIDGHFLALGGVLAQAVDGLGKLVASLDQMKTAIDGGLVAAITAELQAATRDLLALPGRHAERTETIRRLAASAERLAMGVDDMRLNLAYLRVFAINIKITAGGIAAAGKEFAVFAQEIGEGIELGRTRLDTFDADLAALRAGFTATARHEQVLAAQCASLFPAVPDGLIASARSMVEHHQRVGQVAGEVAGLVRNVQKKVGQALGALQIGDITRQRIEHASEALELLGEVEHLTPGQRERMAGFIHRLLTAQLQATAEEFDRDVGRIGAAMGGIAGDAAEILRLRDLAFGRETDDGGGFLRQLEGRVDQALTVVSDLTEADRRALQMGATVSAASASLGEQIVALQTVKADVQHMALNTALKCSRIGDAGKPLAVIAVELRLHAGHMETSAQAALEALDGLSQDAGRLAQADGDSGGGFSESVSLALSDVAQRLRTVGDQVEADLASLASDGAAVVEGLRRASASMDFRHEIGAVVDDAAQALAEGVGQAAAITADIEGPLGELLARIAKRYTMAQEREVHASLTAGLTLAAPAGEPAADAAELDDVLF